MSIVRIEVKEGRGFIGRRGNIDRWRRRWGSNGELMCWMEVERWENGKVGYGEDKKGVKNAVHDFASTVLRSVRRSNSQSPSLFPFCDLKWWFALLDRRLAGSA
ncbi:hypothetical protein HAX54_016755 [Datura stramonium]|uniref:Uncharacterized protein n=1 Tax=Datura stramonium TaxID=4076 RepID=A0ABS8S0V3_DATST|nr:hypothetical protein [Datura stramonium]